MNTISNPLMSLHNSRQAQPDNKLKQKQKQIRSSNNQSGGTMSSQQIYQAAAMNDLARRHYAQTISRATNLSHLQLLSRYHQQQQQQLYCLPPPANHQHQPTFTLEPAQAAAMLSPQQHQKYATFSQQRPPPPTTTTMMESLMSAIDQQALLNKPLCRCRVMYLGSSVPHITKNGLHGIQEPLRHLYPDEQFNNSASRPSDQQKTIDISHLSAELGIDSWLSVWSNGLLLENVDEFGREIKRFFSIEALHYCAAVRYFDASSLMNANGDQPTVTEEMPEKGSVGKNNDQNNNNSNQEQESVQDPSEPVKPALSQMDAGGQTKSVVRFLPLDAPLFQWPGMVDTKHPPMFSAILRRTSGIKVLECHAFICRRDAAANALVRCCTHAYADLLSARRMSASSGSQLIEQHQQQQLHQPTTFGWHPAADSTGGHHLYRPSQQMYHPSSATNHLSLARRGRHQEGRQRSRRDASSLSLLRPQLAGQRGANYDDDDDVVVVDGGSSSSSGSKVKQQHNNSSSCDDTPSSLCDGRDGTNSSGDDNYAIISRHQSRANSRGPTESTTTTAVPDKRSETAFSSSTSSGPSRAAKRAASAAARGRAAAAVGSSRSLFDDFMPNVVGKSMEKTTTQRTTTMTTASTSRRSSRLASRAAEDGKLISHSMDLLQLQPTRCECADTCGGCCGCDLLSSSAEAQTKRHSKSMQNLLAFPPHQHQHQQRVGSFSSSRASLHSVCSSSQRPSGSSMTHRRRHRLHRSKRSLQDIRNCSSAATTTEPVAVAEKPDPMRGERANEPAAAAATDNIYDKPAPAAASASNYYERIEVRPGAKSGAAAKKRDRSRLTTNGGSNSLSSSSANTTRRLSSATATMDGFHPGAASVQLYAPPSLAHQFSAASNPQQQQQPSHHLASIQMPPMPMPPMAMPMAPAPPIDYYGGTLLKYPAPTGYCLPAYDFHMAAAAAAAAYGQQQRLLANTLQHHYGPNSLAASQHQQASIGALATLRKRKQQVGQQTTSKSASLATRFRCLSPPLNFISGSAAAKPPQNGLRPDRPSSNAISNLSAVGQETTTTAAAAAATTTKASGHPTKTRSQESVVVVARSSSSSAAGSGIDELNVVSAKPGFISHSSASIGRLSPPVVAAKRLSWIKRLSLTMSGNGPNSRSPDSGLQRPASSATSASTTSTNPAGEHFRLQADGAATPATKQQKKRASRLFAGSLTLGRTTRNKQQQQPALVTSPT